MNIAAASEMAMPTRLASGQDAVPQPRALDKHVAHKGDQGCRNNPRADSATGRRRSARRVEPAAKRHVATEGQPPLATSMRAAVCRSVTWRRMK
jgi:hypothetical protein